jgi:hypothetical protein
VHWNAFLLDLFGPGTWGTAGNLVATVILGVPSAGAAYLGRHHIGRAVSAWWDKWHGPHAVKRHKQAMREHEAEKQQRGEETQ